MALFQPINPLSLVERQSFAPESKFNVLGGIQGVIEQGRVDAEAQRQKQAAQAQQQLFAQGSQAAFEGTASAQQISELFASNPERAKQVLEGAGAFNDTARQQVADTAFRIQSAPFNQRAGMIQQAAAQVQQSGGDPNRILGLLNMPEAQQNEQLEVFQQAALSVQQRQAQDLSEREFGLKEREVGIKGALAASQISTAQATAGQRVAQLDFDKQKLEVRKLEAEQTALNNQIKQETNALKRDELRLKVNEKAAQIEQSKLDTQFTIDSSVAAIDDTITTTERLLEGEGLEKAAGISSAFFTTPGSDAANFEAVLDTFKSQQFIQEVDKMRGLGALGEKEGQKLIDSAGSLNLSMSDKVLRREITRIQAKLKQARGRIQKKFSITPNTQQSGGVVSSDIGGFTKGDIQNMSTEDLQKLLGQ